MIRSPCFEFLLWNRHATSTGGLQVAGSRRLSLKRNEKRIRSRWKISNNKKRCGAGVVWLTTCIFQHIPLSRSRFVEQSDEWNKKFNRNVFFIIWRVRQLDWLLCVRNTVGTFGSSIRRWIPNWICCSMYLPTSFYLKNNNDQYTYYCWFESINVTAIRRRKNIHQTCGACIECFSPFQFRI